MEAGNRPVRKLLRLAEVVERTGRSRTRIYDDIGKGLFPAPVPIGPRAARWVEGEVDAWIGQRIAERDGGGRARAAVGGRASESAAAAPSERFPPRRTRHARAAGRQPTDDPLPPAA
jgi:prophage regulatory protein